MAIQDSRLQYYLLSFLSILAIRYASTTSYFAASVQAMPDVLSQSTPDVCQSVDQPNPIAATYPNNATGTLNGTIAILPIPLDLARSLIPSQYRILEHAYRSLLPSFPVGMYPALLQALHDHDVQAFGIHIPDFSRASIEFPFVDLLGDNSTSFKWNPTQFLSRGHELAIQGAQAYGIDVFEATFDPPCDAYRAAAPAAHAHAHDQQTTTTFVATSAHACLETVFKTSTSTSTTSTSHDEIPLAFFKNVTNQVIFADAKTCDNMIRLYDTAVSLSPHTIQRVTGSVKAHVPPFDAEQTWEHVSGLRFDSAFIENNYLPCENFRGYPPPS
ncbi:hypothetical protein ACEQ8H_003485 [Pleosporales sp. CAS-2024a]